MNLKSHYNSFLRVFCSAAIQSILKLLNIYPLECFKSCSLYQDLICYKFTQPLLINYLEEYLIALGDEINRGNVEFIYLDIFHTENFEVELRFIFTVKESEDLSRFRESNGDIDVTSYIHIDETKEEMNRSFKSSLEIVLNECKKFEMDFKDKKTKFWNLSFKSLGESIDNKWIPSNTINFENHHNLKPLRFVDNGAYRFSVLMEVGNIK
jgi:hypothetical protein